MKAFLFLELAVIFSSAILLTTQLFYNCLNESHFMLIGGIGVVIALVAVIVGYMPSTTTLALYFVLALAAFGFFMYNLGVGYIVYNFGSDSRAVFIERAVRAELRGLPKYAERSKEKFNSYAYVCRHEAFAFAPGNIDVVYEKESCYGPLAFLIFDTERPEPYSRFRCESNPEGWLVETNDPANDNTLCIDSRRQVVENERPVDDGVRCR